MDLHKDEMMIPFSTLHLNILLQEFRQKYPDLTVEDCQLIQKGFHTYQYYSRYFKMTNGYLLLPLQRMLGFWSFGCKVTTQTKITDMEVFSMSIFGRMPIHNAPAQFTQPDPQNEALYQAVFDLIPEDA